MTVEPLFRTLGTRSTAVVVASVFYLIHLLLQAKIASSEVAAGFAFVFVVCAIAVGEVRFSLHILCFPLAIYGVGSTLSALLASRHVHVGGELMLWIKMATFPTAVILFRTVPPLRGIVVKAQAIVVSGLSIWGMFQFFALGDSDLDHRITAGATHVMTFSGIILPLSLLFAVLWFHERKPWMLASASLGAFALLLSLTRSAWLAWVVSVFVVMLFSRPRWIAIAAPLLLLFITFMPLGLFGRLASSFDPRVESNFDRIRMAQAGVEIIRDYPLFGVGPANVKQMYPLYRAADAPRFRTPHLHNNLIQIWAERGVIAVLGYLLLLILFLRECLRRWRGPAARWAQAGVAIAVSLTVAGMFEFNFGDTEVFYLLLDLCALVVVELEAAGGFRVPPPAELAPAFG